MTALSVIARNEAIQGDRASCAFCVCNGSVTALDRRADGNARRFPGLRRMTGSGVTNPTDMILQTRQPREILRRAARRRQAFRCRSRRVRRSGSSGRTAPARQRCSASSRGALKPSAGKVWLDGKDVTDLSAQARCRAGIGRSHQVPLPFEKLTVFENVLTAACFGKGKRERDVVEHCGAVLEETHLLGESQPARRLVDADRSQAPGDGARARDRPSPPAAR